MYEPIYEKRALTETLYIQFSLKVLSGTWSFLAKLIDLFNPKHLICILDFFSARY